MFLITTADQRFWKTDEKVLFLGEWCKLYQQKHVWSEIEYQVLPYHWDDRDNLHEEYLRLQEVYERYLKLIAGKLNELHRVDHSPRYWRIIIGGWLYYFIQSFYDRYLSISNAGRSGLVTNSWIADSSPSFWTPRDFSQFAEWFIADAYNHCLYSYLIKRLNQVPFEVITGETNLSSEPVARQSGARKLAGRLLGYYLRLVAGGRNSIIFVDSDLSFRELITLQLSLRQWPHISTPRVEPAEKTVDDVLRSQIVLNEGSNEFESILDDLIPLQIPTVFLEGYHEMRERVEDAFPKRCALIMSATAVGSEGFRFWSAGQVERGARLAITVHGGGYGSCLWMSNEEHEIEVSDRYYTWGWRTEGEPRTVPLSVRKFARYEPLLKPKPDGPILWVTVSYPRYSYWMYSVPVGPQTLDYFAEQHRFAQAVSPAVHQLLILRPYVSDYGWNEVSRWQELDPMLTCYQGPRSMEQQLSESRLMIATYNATTFLGTFAADFPTIIFWNPAQWEMRAAAKPYFDELREAGILHDTPESAALLVNDIYQDPQSWWLSPQVRKAKTRFCNRFVWTNNEWLREWKRELLTQVPTRVN